MNVAEWPKPTYHHPPSLVVGVHDGDTFKAWVRLACWGLSEQWVRLSDSSSPELHEPGGPEAAAHLASLVHGRYVYLQTFRMATRDEEQRTFVRLRALAYVDRTGELVSVGALMVEAGHAEPIVWT